MNEYVVYSVKDYKIHDFKKFMMTNLLEFDSIDDICDELIHDKFYHFRVENETQYIFFGDLDGYQNDIKIFFEFLKKYLLKYYDIKIELKDIKYTQNSDKNDSYHYSIPKLNASTEKLKEIHVNILKDTGNEFIKTDNTKIIDTTIYSSHWFRCPNQSKSNNQTGIHEIKYGNMEDFIITHICDNSININNNTYNNIEDENKMNTKKKDKNNKKEIENIIKSVRSNEILNEKTDYYNKEYIIKHYGINELKTLDYKQIIFIIQLIDILSSKYYNEYDYWYKIGMILKVCSKLYNFNFLQVFDDFSNKSIKYDKVKTNQIWNKFNTEKITITLGSLYYFARTSNLSNYKKIITEYYVNDKIEITEKVLCFKLHEIAGNYFFYLNNTLYSFNNKNNLWFQSTQHTIRTYINDELYDYMLTLLIDSITDETYLKAQIKMLKKYCQTYKYQNEVVKVYEDRYKENMEQNDIKFDANPYLFGFNNGVFDLKENIFRAYKYDDYITTRTGYKYIESSEEEQAMIHQMMKETETEDDKRYLLWQILASGIIGSCSGTFAIFLGKGGNSKSLWNKFMLEALGNYAYKASIKTLCSQTKTGANPEIANMDQKRYVIFSEPESDEKIYNAVLKELTGAVQINARKLYENKCNIMIPATFVLESNHPITLKSESSQGEERRMINYNFLSTFTKDITKVDEEKRIFYAKLMNDDFIAKYKNAFMDILLKRAHQFIIKDLELFKIPKSVSDSTEEYLLSSYGYMRYFKECLCCTNDDNDYITLHNLYQNFKQSDYFINASKQDRLKYSAKDFKSFFETKLKKYYINKMDKIINGTRTQCNSVIIKHKIVDNLL
jgi:phage/plasmid-associated DNA primase